VKVEDWVELIAFNILPRLAFSLNSLAISKGLRIVGMSAPPPHPYFARADSPFSRVKYISSFTQSKVQEKKEVHERMKNKELVELGIALLDPNPFQARIEYPEEELKNLGRSIKEHGMLEPIIVRPHNTKPGCFEIAVGERRVRACRLVGIATVPAIVRNLSDDEMALYVPVENLQRRDLNPIEEARAFRTLQERGWTQQKIADEVGHGVTRDIVGQRLRLFGFPPELQELVSHDTITPAHAETIARLADDPPILKDTISKVVNQKLTSKETEQLVGELLQKQALHKDILDYLTSEEFLPTIQYLLYTATIGSDAYCPFDCGETVVYEEFKDAAGMDWGRTVCKECGWELGFCQGPLFEIVARIRELRGTRNQPKPASEETKS
jgi:ParB family chromosome partitioning protein